MKKFSIQRTKNFRLNWIHIIILIIGFGPGIYARSFEESPFGFHPASIYLPGYNQNGFFDAENIGVRWHRPPVYAFWFMVQPDLGDSTLNFSFYDALYGSVPSSINILVNIAPQGHIDEGYCLPGSYLPVDSAKYVRFVKATVERYDGDGIYDMPGLVNPIRYWQVGNEPSATSPSGFAAIQRITYQAIKEVCPGCWVLIGGAFQPINPFGFVVDTEEYLEWFSIFYEPILEELDGKGVDIFDFHWYGQATGDYRKCGVIFDSLKSILTRHNFGEIPIWITEMGSYSGNPTEPQFGYQSEAQQAGDYLKRFIYPFSIGVEKIFPAFGLMEGFIHDDGYFDHTGLIYDGKGSNDLGLGVKKLGYFTYKLMTEKLAGYDWNRAQTLINGLDNIYAYKFTQVATGKPIYVVWWDWFDDSTYIEGDTIMVRLEIGDMDSIRITEAVPDAESGAELNENDYPDFFITRTKPVIDGKVTFTLRENPVFIEEFGAPLRGDANSDGKVTISDVVFVVNYLFKGGPAPNPLSIGDVNCDSSVNVSDVVYLVTYLFKGGPAPCSL